MHLLKDELLKKIKEAIRNLIDDNGAPMSPVIARKALELLMHAKVDIGGSDKNTKEEAYNLTEREKEILKHLVNGFEYNYTTLFNKITARPGAFAYLAHPQATDYGNLLSTYSANAYQAVIGMAARSGPAFSTNSTYSDPATSDFLYLIQYFDLELLILFALCNLNK